MKSKKTLLSTKAILLLALIIGSALLSGGLIFAAGEEPPEVDFGQAAILEELLPLPEPADLNNVYLINCDVLEIEYNEPVTAAQAKALFTIKVDGVEVEWEFLSYFDFGQYATRGGVVNVRLTEPLDTGNPRGRIRTSTANTFLQNTQLTLGPAAAAKITVTAGAATKTAAWKAFYTERSLGYMSRVYAYAAAEAGNNGQQIRDYGTNYDTGNVFSATTEPKYTDEFIARQVAEGMHRFCGRSEFLTLPFVDSGFKALLVGASQSVYEAPEFRELYEYGVTTDTYTRTSINPTAVPGNFLGNGKYKKPFVVGTADDVMRHYS
ncbi:MAG: hypothetical protein FWF85_09465, partial [Clostridiales bacterium]|nr:hypothetical protein [Clostridiales bacterium]